MGDSVHRHHLSAVGMPEMIDILFLFVWCIGYPEKGPYEAIHVGAAAKTVPPALVEQLASPGRLVIPVGTDSQRLMQVDKDARGEITQKDLFGVVVRRPVPLLLIATIN